MSDYLLTWVTDNLAVGHAPMSYAELDDIRAQGIKAIVNLCEEFCDLHELEENSGFEVFYLPIPDEHAPDLSEMEKGLEWLDEAIYLGKKVLVHCHHGVGRTGTFVTAYLLRRGLGMKKAGKILKKTRANPTNFSQWWLLRKFGKKEGQLKNSAPSAENRAEGVDLSEFYARYEQVLRKIDTLHSSPDTKCCDKTAECSDSFALAPIEALYLNNKVNIELSAEQRKKVIEIASDKSSDSNRGDGTAKAGEACPLRLDNKCLLYKYRPVHCRLRIRDKGESELQQIMNELDLLSSEVFTALFGKDSSSGLPPEVSNRESISGKFIQRYFQFLTSQKTTNDHDRD